MCYSSFRVLILKISVGLIEMVQKILFNLLNSIEEQFLSTLMCDVIFEWPIYLVDVFVHLPHVPGMSSKNLFEFMKKCFNNCYLQFYFVIVIYN